MDMCTPQVTSNKHMSKLDNSSTIHQRQRRTSECSNAFPKLNECSLIRKRNYSVDTSTPNGGGSIMDICTPVIMNGRGSMELCTPATRKLFFYSTFLINFMPDDFRILIQNMLE